MANDFWASKHASYSDQDWIAKPSLFAETVQKYLPQNAQLLELGAGLGQDSRFFASSGHSVTATDLNVGKLNESSDRAFSVERLDLREPFRFEDERFDVVYAHLSLHYFDEQTTERMFTEIRRVLKPGGVLAFFVNSTTDPEYGTGTQLGRDYFDIGGVKKRYFDVESVKQFAKGFEPIIADTNGETYKDSVKGVHNLVRFVGAKV